MPRRKTVTFDLSVDKLKTVYAKRTGKNYISAYGELRRAFERHGFAHQDNDGSVYTSVSAFSKDKADCLISNLKADLNGGSGLDDLTYEQDQELRNYYLRGGIFENMSLNNANDTEKYIKALTPERKALLDRGFDMINEKYGKTLDALAGNDVDFDDAEENR